MTGVPTLGQALNQIERIKVQQTQFDTLASQMATGKKTQRFSGLGSDILTSQRARANVKSLDRYINNITNADRRMNLMLGSLEEFQAQTENLANALVNFSQRSSHQKGDVVEYDDPGTANFVETDQVGLTSSESDVDLDTLTRLATDLFDIAVDLLNSRDGDTYLLGGADSQTKPLGNTETMDAAISYQIEQWKDGNITNAQLIADITNGDTTNNSDAISDTIVGYSSAMSAGNVGEVTVRASDGIEVEYTTLANEDPLRDIIVALGFLKNSNLTPIVDTYEPPNAPPNAPDAKGAPGDTIDEMKENFYAVFNSVMTMVSEAVDGIDTMRFRVESARARIDGLKETHKDAKAILLDTVSNVEDVDVNEVAVKISNLQVQLETTYAITARIQNLSLINFIQ